MESWFGDRLDLSREQRLTIVRNADSRLAYDSDRPELRHTIGFVRSHRHLARWHSHPDGDSAHEKILQEWRHHSSMCSVTWKDEPKLLDTATVFLDDEDDRLAAVWHAATSDPLWGQLNQSDRDYYTVAHALATDPRRGGRRVQLSNRMALALIASVTGHEYTSLQVISKARNRLEVLGLISVKVGAQFTPGVRSRATVVDLLGVDNPCFRHRDCSPGDSSPLVPRPYLADTDREAMADAIEDSRRAKLNQPPEPRLLREQRRREVAAGVRGRHQERPEGDSRMEIAELKRQAAEQDRRIATLTAQVDQMQAQLAQQRSQSKPAVDWDALLLGTVTHATDQHPGRREKGRDRLSR